jgi:uncharacterized Fe-S cluster-containing radical SAM superfamily protein
LAERELAESELIVGGKFIDPERTLEGKARAKVRLEHLETLWFNTGTLCNVACENCYIESTPRNDRLSYLSRDDVGRYLDEIEALGLATRTIGLTGGEPFMNPEVLGIMEGCLQAGYELLVLTNAMRPMLHHRAGLLDLRARFGDQLTVRVSVDHYQRSRHEEERGPRSWRPMIEGLSWLSASGFRVHVAGRTRWEDSEADLRRGFAGLFATHEIAVDANDPAALMLFPEMDAQASVPEITNDCWDILGVDPRALMCASSRMVIKRRGSARPVVAACTLLPYDERFELDATLAESLDEVSLNHPHCARFCVLGGGSCTA